MNTGFKPKYDCRDLVHPTYGATQLPDFPTEHNVDAGLWNPNQNNTNAPAGIDIIPPLPFGCTDYSQVDLYNDHTKALHSPMILEEITHANQRGGIDLREALNAARKLGWFDNYSQVRGSGLIDMFDAIRIALLSERQDYFGISAGTPYFSEWSGKEILPIPVFDLTQANWHNWDIKGFKYIDDQPYLICKMWDGTWKYMSRPLCNALFGIRGSVAFIPSNTAHDGTTIDFNFVDWIVSFIRNLIATQPKPAVVVIDHLPVTPPSMYEWNTPPKARHSVRLIADEMGLTVEQKNLLCQVIHCESGFNINAKHVNSDRRKTTDYGICMFNSYWYADLITPDEAQHNPEKAVRLMITEMKVGRLKDWVCYSAGLYKTHPA